MIDRLLCTFTLLLVLIVGGLLLHQQLTFTRYEQQQKIIEAEIKELKKKDRLTAQDIQFLETLVIEGGINEK
ncbi:MAG: hypothetical protein J6S85_11455 [Methanobrevibacter sp.]|jgi:hypothetical protein|nr:hypothetical protein [Methanobrevibacter sp.]